VIARLPGAALLILMLTASAQAWPLTYGSPGGNRVVAGRGSFPRLLVISAVAEAPVRWIVSLPGKRLCAIDANGTLWIFELGRTELHIVGRYGEVASPDGPPVTVTTGEGRSAVVAVAPDGRLLVWSEGVLRAFDVGSPLSRLTFPVPVTLEGKARDDLLAVAADGAMVLIGGLPSAPRVLSRVDAHALPDARITVGSLDGSAGIQAVVLSDPTDRYPHGALGDKLEASAVTVVTVAPNALVIRFRYVIRAPAVMEDLIPIVVPVGEGRRPALVVAKSAPLEGSSVMVLGWREAGLVVLAEGPSFGQSNRWVHVLGAADLSGDGKPELVAVNTPHLTGVLVAYERHGGVLVPTAKALGYASHAFGSRNQDQAVMADMSGNGRLEVILPRQSRDALAALELSNGRWEERWALQLAGRVQSNLLVGDLDGDGLLDLVVADRRGLHVFLSVR
jgi:VCBS repeat protein